MIEGFRQRGHHVEIQRFSLCARLFGTVEDRPATRAFRQRLEQMFGGERTIQAHFQYPDFFVVGQQFIHHFFAGADGGTHNHNHALGLRMAIILKRLVAAAGGVGEVIHRLLDVRIDCVIPRVSCFA